MSFRGRLAIFFILIVILPLVAAGVLVRDVTADSEDGKADATISAGLETATNVYEDNVAEADRVAQEIAADPALGEALRQQDPAAVEARAGELAAAEDVEGLLLRDSGGTELARVGAAPEVVVGTVELQGGSGGAVGSLEVSLTTPEAFLEQAASLTGERPYFSAGATSSRLPPELTPPRSRPVTRPPTRPSRARRHASQPRSCPDPATCGSPSSHPSPTAAF